MLLNDKLQTVENKYNELITKRKEIITNHFNRKNNVMKEKAKKNVEIINEVRNMITSHETKTKMYNQFIRQFTDLNDAIEVVNNGKRLK